MTYHVMNFRRRQIAICKKFMIVTIENFGSHQAIEYLTGPESISNTTCKHPDTGRSRNEIRRGLRCISYVSHIIFYRTVGKRIRIVRVLHASRGLPKFL